MLSIPKFQYSFNSTNLLISVSANMLLREIDKNDLDEITKMRDNIATAKGNIPFVLFDEKHGGPKGFIENSQDWRYSKKRDNVFLAVADVKNPKIVQGIVGEFAVPNEEQNDWDNRIGYCNLGIVTNPEFQNKGITSTALSAFCGSLLFDVANYPSISATVRPDNPASITVLKKVGLTKYADINVSHYGDGKPRDILSATRREFFTKPFNIKVQSQTKISGIEKANGLSLNKEIR